MTEYYCRLCGAHLLLRTGENDGYSYLWYECPVHPDSAQHEAPPTVKIEGV